MFFQQGSYSRFFNSVAIQPSEKTPTTARLTSVVVHLLCVRIMDIGNDETYI